ncbi:PAS domain S-box protein [Mucilaginibacter gilvus]|uniref:histidine kinase n=1 Tax=Mucilaginibacter gilvus TaxID=2305909 RepID=A0A3S3VKQ6_9SPHI|nr:PAS domain S-box protein [Mucilaginibacter gilvus]RWY50368.1 PAS domain S-box protein [Mucilaginibacter gilvus]
MLDHATLNHIFALIPSPTLILLPDAPVFTIADVNQNYLNAVGLASDDLTGKSFFDYFGQFPDKDMSDDLNSLNQVLQTKAPHQTGVNQYKFSIAGSTNLQTKYFSAANVPVLDAQGNVTYIVHTVSDVTETVAIKHRQERTKKNLQETSLLMSQGQELANFGNWQWDIVNNKVSWSNTLYTIYGLDKESFKATFEGYQELLHPDDREFVNNKITHVLQTKEDAVFEERIIRPNGELRYLKSWGKVQSDEQGNPIKMIGACLDITETKFAEAQLTKMHHELEEHLKTLAISEKRYSDLFHLSPLPMWVFNLDTRRFLNVNAAAITHYGYTLEEFLEMDVTKVWPADCVNEFEETINDSHLVYNGISTQTKKNGEQIKVYLQSNFIQFSGENTHLVLAMDITERQNYIHAIEEKNKHLLDIAWIQSHVVRAPLARIMGLIELFKSYDISEIDKNNLLDNIALSANELDGIIRGISDKTEEIVLNKE